MRTLLFILVLLPSFLFASSTADVAQLFQQLKKNPQALRLFLLQMPKGGELHYHWDGSTYPENMAYDIRDSGFCYNASILGVDSDDKFCAKANRLNDLADNPTLYQNIVNNWSLTTDFSNRIETNQHFFQFFMGTEPVVEKYSGAMLADEIQRAANQHEDYMEMVYILDVPQMILLGQQLNFTPDFVALNNEVNKTGISSLVDDINTSTTHDYKKAYQNMQCGTAQAQSGCHVKVRFLFSALRSFPPATVFAELAIAFKVADTNPLVLGIDLVGPENDYNSSRDYTLQMHMVHFFHTLYPKVHIRLHAG